MLRLHAIVVVISAICTSGTSRSLARWTVVHGKSHGMRRLTNHSNDNPVKGVKEKIWDYGKAMCEGREDHPQCKGFFKDKDKKEDEPQAIEEEPEEDIHKESETSSSPPPETTSVSSSSPPPEDSPKEEHNSSSVPSHSATPASRSASPALRHQHSGAASLRAWPAHSAAVATCAVLALQAMAAALG
mmetsp:Transcript_8344/g.23821  ORF Transcript_8344/g.23821 Transcript_8344/m.23821 type:complete len:187 (-) Transcript_8344:179-739(-)